MARDSSSESRCSSGSFPCYFRHFCCAGNDVLPRQATRRRASAGAAVGRASRQAGCEAPGGGFALELFADSNGRVRIGEENRTERERRRAGGDQLEPVRGLSRHRPSRRWASRSRGRRRRRRRARPAAARAREPPTARRASARACARRERGRGSCSRARGRPRRPPARRAGRPRRHPERGRELRVERLRRRGARPAATISAARLGRLGDVRAGQVQLERRDPARRRDARKSPRIRRREAADGDPDRNAEVEEARQVLGEEAVDARVASPIELSIPCVGLGDARRRVALPRQRRHRLRHEGVERSRDLRRGRARRGSRRR